MNHRVVLCQALTGFMFLFCVNPGHATTTGHAKTHAHTSKRTHHAAAAARSPAGGAPVVLTSQPGTSLDKEARRLNAEDMAAAARHKERPLVLIGSAPLSTSGGSMALFVQVQSASLCGSAGCSTDVYLKRGNDWDKILDSVSGPIELMSTSHGDMKDIVVDGTDRWVWKNNTYVDTIVAQDVPGLKDSIEQHQAQMRKHGKSSSR